MAGPNLHSDHVIVGGGAGGLLLAARLGRRLGPDRVLLVDRAVTHVWKPVLNEVAAGTRDSHQEALPYPLLARRNRFRFAVGKLAALDPAARRLTLAPVLDEDGSEVVPERTVRFRNLVLATGAGSNLFGAEGAAEHAFRLDDADDARRFNRRLTTAFLGAAFSAGRILRIAIVGGGPTGVELAAEIHAAHADLFESLADDQRFALDITVLEMAPEILGGLPEPVTERARRTLKRLGVRLMTETKVQRIRPDGLDTSDGPIPADLTVWAAGTQAEETNTRLGLEMGKLNQFVVNDRLETSAPDIRAIGDCAQAPGPGGKPLPPRAQIAAQQAAWLADVLLDGRSGPFVHRERGSVVSLGPDDSAGTVKAPGRSLFVEGVTASWMHMTLHLDHHRQVLGLRRTALLALSRLLQHGGAGRTRLH